MKNKKYVLLAVIVAFIAVYIYVLTAFGLQGSRWIRLFSSLALFGLYLKWRRDRGIALLSAFGLFVLSDVLNIGFESPGISKLYSAVLIAAYLLLIFHIRPMIRKLKVNLVEKAVFVLVLGINLLMILFLLDMMEFRIEELQMAFLFLHSIVMIALVTLAFSYTHRYSSKPSFYFVCAVLGLVFSDISGFISYYLQVQEFILPDRILYLLALTSLVRFASLEKDEVIDYGKSLL